MHGLGIGLPARAHAATLQIVLEREGPRLEIFIGTVRWHLLRSLAVAYGAEAYVGWTVDCGGHCFDSECLCHIYTLSRPLSLCRGRFDVRIGGAWKSSIGFDQSTVYLITHWRLSIRRYILREAMAARWTLDGLPMQRQRQRGDTIHSMPIKI